MQLLFLFERKLTPITFFLKMFESMTKIHRELWGKLRIRLLSFFWRSETRAVGVRKFRHGWKYTCFNLSHQCVHLWEGRMYIWFIERPQWTAKPTLDYFIRIHFEPPHLLSGDLLIDIRIVIMGKHAPIKPSRCRRNEKNHTNQRILKTGTKIAWKKYFQWRGIRCRFEVYIEVPKEGSIKNIWRG